MDNDDSGAPDATWQLTITVPLDEQLDAAFQREGIGLQSGEFRPSQELHDTFLGQLAAADADGLHSLISLYEACVCQEAFQLEQLGLTRQTFLPGWNSYGLVDQDIDLDDPLRQAKLRYLTPLEPEDKVDPNILLANYDQFVVVENGERTDNYFLSLTGRKSRPALLPPVGLIHRSVATSAYSWAIECQPGLVR